MSNRPRLRGSRRDAPTSADTLGASVPLYAQTHGVNPTLTAGLAGTGLPVPEVRSPMSDGTLTAIVWADLIGDEFRPVTRAAAMAIPALARQRHLICGTLARCPLVSMTGEAVDANQPSWLYRTDSAVSTYHRTLWTADDLIFYGWSLWSRTMAAGTTFPLDAVRVPWERWAFDKVGNILVDGKKVAAAEVILIPGAHEGIVNFGGGAIRRAIDNANASATAARNPSAYMELHYTGEEPLTDTQIDSLIERWAAARRGENGGVSYTGKNVELKEHGTHESHLLIEGRNADAVDMSRLVSSPSSMADATNAGASLTYETTDGRNGEFIDYGVSLYADPIAARLSLDDCVARGHRVAFDYSVIRNLAAPTTGAPRED